MKVRKKLDVVLIATIRPDILRITLNSFKNKLLNQFNVRLILNVDPIGDHNYSQEDIVRICQEYFPNMLVRTPNTPSFSDAVLWAWQQVNTDFFLHLESDWCLKRPIDIQMIDEYFGMKDVVSVRFNLSSNRKFRFVEGVVYCDGLSLNPSFIKRSYLKELINIFDVSKDPEKQYKNRTSFKNFEAPKFLLYGSHSEKSIVIDTGKKWRKAFGFNKWEQDANSVVWKFEKLCFLRTSYLKVKYLIYLLLWSKRYCNGIKFQLLRKEKQAYLSG